MVKSLSVVASAVAVSWVGVVMRLGEDSGYNEESECITQTAVKLKGRRVSSLGTILTEL